MARERIIPDPRTAGGGSQGAPAQVPYVYGAKRTGLARRTLEELRRRLPPDPDTGRRTTPLPPREVVFPGVLTQEPDPEPEPGEYRRNRKANHYHKKAS
jgi:hypothetical protein